MALPLARLTTNNSSTSEHRQAGEVYGLVFLQVQALAGLRRVTQVLLHRSRGRSRFFWKAHLAYVRQQPYLKSPWRLIFPATKSATNKVLRLRSEV